MTDIHKKIVSNIFGLSSTNDLVLNDPLTGTSATISPAAMAALGAGTTYTDEEARDALAAALTAGTGITVTPNDGANTITLATTITQYTDEMAQDTIAAAFAAGTHTGMTVTYTDGSNKFDLASTITQYTDEMAQDALATAFAAGTHTGITVGYTDGSNLFNLSTAVTVTEETAETYIFELADDWVEFNRGTAQTATIPPNTDVAFPIGKVIQFAQKDAGQTTIAAGVGVTLKLPAAFLAKTAQQEAVGSIIKIATDTWRITGQLEAA